MAYLGPKAMWAVHVEITVDIAVHGEMFACHGSTGLGKRSRQIRVAQDSEDLLGKRACLNRSQKPCA